MDIVESSLSSLEWDRFLSYFSGFCLSEPAREAAQFLEIPAERAKSEHATHLTTETIGVLSENPFSDLQSLPNLTEILPRLELGAPLSGIELFRLSECIRLSEITRKFFAKKSQARFLSALE